MDLMLQEEKKTIEDSAMLLDHISIENGVYKIDADSMHYRELNQLLRALDIKGAEKIEIHNVYGQRYIGTDLRTAMEIEIYGTPGNDLGVFMNGQKLVVHGNAQDCSGNTMNDGQIVIHGGAGDITGYGMRGGKIFVRDNVGYRTGIHMKEYMDKKPYLVVGGTAQDFLGEYMAGGILVVFGLNLKDGETHKARYVGTGMHNGTMYISGGITHLGKEVKVMEVNKSDLTLIQSLAKEFCGHFNFNIDEVMTRKFSKIVPVSHRPYGTVYAY
jgi:glutamate synthase domain-containing protein 3